MSMSFKREVILIALHPIVSNHNDNINSIQQTYRRQTENKKSKNKLKAKWFKKSETESHVELNEIREEMNKSESKESDSESEDENDNLLAPIKESTKKRTSPRDAMKVKTIEIKRLDSIKKDTPLDKPVIINNEPQKAIESQSKPKKKFKKKKRTSQSVEQRTGSIPFEKKKSIPMSKDEYWNFEFDKTQKKRKRAKSENRSKTLETSKTPKLTSQKSNKILSNIQISNLAKLQKSKELREKYTFKSPKNKAVSYKKPHLIKVASMAPLSINLNTASFANLQGTSRSFKSLVQTSSKKMPVKANKGAKTMKSPKKTADKAIQS